MSSRAGKRDGGPNPCDGARQVPEHESRDGSIRSLGEVRAAELRPWKQVDSGIPEFSPGTLDAAVILQSLNVTLLPVLEKELEAVTRRLGAVLAEAETEENLAALFRAELMRRVLPQFTEAVRAGVLQSIRTRQMHLAQLAVLHRQVLEAKSLRAALIRIDHEVARAGLQIVGETGDLSLFNIVEEPPGVMEQGPVTLELMVPAYVDKESGKVVERGWLRAVVGQNAPSAGHADPDPAPGAEKVAPAPSYRKMLRAAVIGRLGAVQRGKR
ncbi:hypothetical protein [Streptomyces coelicoflavus]|uniref:hypothetical protein n=1 Tax=Streptomyces coelicoflavus TaxID=285562 RepID=UPI003318E2D8